MPSRKRTTTIDGGDVGRDDGFILNDDVFVAEAQHCRGRYHKVEVSLNA